MLPVTFCRSIAYYAVFYVGSVLLVLASLVALPMGQNALRAVVASWARFHRWCLRVLVGITVRIEGTLPREAMLVAIKHESYFEAIDTPCLLEFPSVFAKQELFALPGWGLSARIYGLIPVARDKGARALRAMIRTARERIAEGRPLVIFPEGTRVRHADAPVLQSGFAGIYKLLDLPVVPIAVNSGPLYRRFLKQPGTITYQIGEVIPPGLAREEIEAAIHHAINQLNPSAPLAIAATRSHRASSERTRA